MSARFLMGDRLYLRAPEKGDIDSFLSWFNDAEVLEFVHRYRPLSRAEEEEWFAGLHKRESDFLFLIALREDDAAIGCCGLHGLSVPNRSAELGIAIGEKRFWSHGYGSEAMRLLCGYGFEALNLHRIGLSVYEYNRRGLRCYEKIGFRREGNRRQARYWKGGYHDVILMGLLAAEWFSARDGEKVSQHLDVGHEPKSDPNGSE